MRLANSIQAEVLLKGITLGFVPYVFMFNFDSFTLLHVLQEHRNAHCGDLSVLRCPRCAVGPLRRTASIDPALDCVDVVSLE